MCNWQKATGKLRLVIGKGQYVIGNLQQGISIIKKIFRKANFKAKYLYSFNSLSDKQALQPSTFNF